MSTNIRYGLEQARTQLPTLAAQANAGISSIITKHGKPYAAIVPADALQKWRTAAETASGILALRGTGGGLWGGLWGDSVGQTIADLRDEWGDA
jgi:prevent-host-death family protein